MNQPLSATAADGFWGVLICRRLSAEITNLAVQVGLRPHGYLIAELSRNSGVQPLYLQVAVPGGPFDWHEELFLDDAALEAECHSLLRLLRAYAESYGAFCLNVPARFGSGSLQPQLA